MASIRSRLVYRLYSLRPSPFSPEYSIPEQRVRTEKMAKAARMPGAVTIETTRVGRVPAEWLRPVGAKSERALLYLHGGGYCVGSCETHRALAARIGVASRACVLLLEYRLAPEHPFPAALEDSLAALVWLAKEGITPAGTGLVGDSAGGGLVLATALSFRDAGRALPAAVACLSPWTDLSCSGESVTTCRGPDPLLNSEGLVAAVQAYIGEGDRKAPLVSPLFADLSRLPPLLTVVVKRDPPCRTYFTA
jgi:monoterpene epsilon-lactone hydrolase